MIVWLTRLVKIMALQVDVNSSRCVDLAKLHLSPVSQFSVLCPCPDCSFYTITTCTRCYASQYKLVIQLSVSLFGIHNLGPAALGSVYPVETSTSLYNLYLQMRTLATLGLSLYVPIFTSKSLNVLEGSHFITFQLMNTA